MNGEPSSVGAPRTAMSASRVGRSARTGARRNEAMPTNGKLSRSVTRNKSQMPVDDIQQWLAPPEPIEVLQEEIGQRLPRLGNVDRHMGGNDDVGHPPQPI